MKKLPTRVMSAVLAQSSLGSDVWIGDKSAVVFGDSPNNDMVFLSPVKKQVTPSHYISGHRQSEKTIECEKRVEQVKNLRRSAAQVTFIMRQKDMRALIEAGVQQNATHLRFYNSGAALRINVIDARKFDNAYQLRRKNTLTIPYLEIVADIDRDVSWTVKFDSFRKLPLEDFDCYIYANGIGAFDSLKNESTTYLMRDQQLIEPVVVFHSPQVMRDISFVFHPKKDWLNLDTTQSG